MSAPHLVGLCGFARVGKDSVAKVLTGEYGLARVAFADALRDLLYELNPHLAVARGDLRYFVDTEGWDTVKQWEEVRRLLQRTGMAARKVLGDDIWVDAAFRKVDRALYCTPNPLTNTRAMNPECSGVVITDVRFENEALRISDEGGELWYVRRPGVGPVNDHESELLAQEMEDFYQQWAHHGLQVGGSAPYHRVVNNDGGLDDLAAKVRSLAAEPGIVRTP